MKHRFLPHSLSHTWVVVDITKIGLPMEVYPEMGEEQMVPSLRFQRWSDVERFFLGLGAGAEALLELSAALKRHNTSVLTIV